MHNCTQHNAQKESLRKREMDCKMPSKENEMHSQQFSVDFVVATTRKWHSHQKTAREKKSPTLVCHFTWRGCTLLSKVLLICTHNFQCKLLINYVYISFEWNRAKKCKQLWVCGWELLKLSICLRFEQLFIRVSSPQVASV